MIDIQKVTIGQYIDYCKLIESLKPELDKRLFDKDSTSVMDLYIEFPEYIEEVVKFWTGWESVKDKDADLVIGIFVLVEKLTVLPEPLPCKSFEHEGEWYFAPADLQLLRKTQPIGKTSFGKSLEFLQVEQLIQGKYEMIPYVLATLFLKEGESVDDFDLSERVEILRRMPLTKALNAYFFLLNTTSTWLKRINKYLENKNLTK